MLEHAQLSDIFAYFCAEELSLVCQESCQIIDAGLLTLSLPERSSKAHDY